MTKVGILISVLAIFIVLALLIMLAALGNSAAYELGIAGIVLFVLVALANYIRSSTKS